MACYLEVVDLGVWRVTRDGMKPPKNPKKPTASEEKEIHLNARTKNCLYESLSMDIFNQVFTLKTANEIWLKLHELHDGTSNVREQKHCLVLNEYNSFAMKDDELCRRFETGGSLSRRVSVSRAPAQMGRARGRARRGESEVAGDGRERGGNPAAFVFVPRPGRVRYKRPRG
jgi:hypothetical protein